MSHNSSTRTINVGRVRCRLVSIFLCVSSRHFLIPPAFFLPHQDRYGVTSMGCLAVYLSETSVAPLKRELVEVSIFRIVVVVVDDVVKL